MLTLIGKYTAAALALAALPGAAHAGTSTANGSAALGVGAQCSVTGGTVNLGTYSSAQTWGDVGKEVGLTDDSTFATAGTKGLQGLNLGSVACENGVPFSLNILGTGGGGSGHIRLTMNGKVVNLLMFVKKVGATPINDGPGGIYAGFGKAMVQNFFASAPGTGAPQAVLGSALVNTRPASAAGGTTALLTDKLTVGTYTDTLSYTLNF
ncbi:MAG: hypothetical protein RLZZ84_435 [Pseudomonadota bacterium]|jgi:spore coat protein U-like protein